MKKVIVLLLLAAPCLAKEHKQTYSQPCKVVWDTVMSLPKHYQYKLVGSSQEGKTITLMAGKSNWTGQRLLPMTLEEGENSCTVTVETRFSGLAHNDAKDLLERISKELPSANPPK